MRRARRGRQRRLETFLKEICWREFAYHLLWHRPEMPEAPLRADFAAFPWSRDAGAAARLAARAAPAIPIVDAGMRQLWRTGWMHNRVRMIAASLPGEAPAAALAGRRGLVLGHAGRCRPRRQQRVLAVGGGLRRRCGALFPRLQPGAAGREIRPRRRLCPPLGARSWRACPTACIHRPGRRRTAVLRGAGVTLGPGLSAPGGGPRRGPRPRAGRLRRARSGAATRRERPTPGRPACRAASRACASSATCMARPRGFAAAIAGAEAAGLFVLQLGDLTDHGPDSPEVLRRMFALIDAGRGPVPAGQPRPQAAPRAARATQCASQPEGLGRTLAQLAAAPDGRGAEGARHRGDRPRAGLAARSAAASSCMAASTRHAAAAPPPDAGARQGRRAW